jgi:putative membrane protein
LVAGGIAAILCLFISKGFSKIISRINYRILCFVVIIFIAVVAFLLSGFIGLLILAVATSIGLVPNLTGIKRSHSMGCLLLPVILWFIL